MSTEGFNAHNKDEYAPAHTTEHLINQTMIRMFNCGRSTEAHIEKKKSKMDFKLASEPSTKKIKELENRINELIENDLPVTYELTTQSEASTLYKLNRLPDNASENIRIVKIGDYDACPCIGKHVERTSEIGLFKIISTNYNEGTLRIRWKTVQR